MGRFEQSKADRENRTIQSTEPTDDPIDLPLRHCTSPPHVDDGSGRS